VVTQTVAPEGAGRWKEYAGGYSDWTRQRAPASQRENSSSEKDKAPTRGKQRAKLSYKETRELEALPKEIEALEAEQKLLAAKMSAPEYYRQPPEALRAEQARGAEIEALLIEKLERWEALEAK
jgi:ATP-binding cassette subfamily F protein uup